jgi:hypothetical protein
MNFGFRSHKESVRDWSLLVESTKLYWHLDSSTPLCDQLVSESGIRSQIGRALRFRAVPVFRLSIEVSHERFPTEGQEIDPARLHHLPSRSGVLTRWMWPSGRIPARCCRAVSGESPPVGRRLLTRRRAQVHGALPISTARCRSRAAREIAHSAQDSPAQTLARPVQHPP